MSSSFLFVGIVAVWAFFLVPRWLRRQHAQPQVEVDVEVDVDVEFAADYRADDRNLANAQDYTNYEDVPAGGYRNYAGDDGAAARYAGRATRKLATPGPATRRPATRGGYAEAATRRPATRGEASRAGLRE